MAPAGIEAKDLVAVPPATPHNWITNVALGVVPEQATRLKF